MRRRPGRQKWRPVVGYEGRYDVSDRGLVWSRLRQIVLKPSVIPKGKYLKVDLHKDGKQSTHPIHKLVARAFLGDPPEGMEVCHGPAGNQDNSLVNLRYGTHAENVQDSVSQETHVSAAKKNCPKNHPLDGRHKNGKRYCKQCNRDRRAAAYAADPEGEKQKMRDYYRRRIAA